MYRFKTILIIFLSFLLLIPISFGEGNVDDVIFEDLSEIFKIKISTLYGYGEDYYSFQESMSKKNKYYKIVNSKPKDKNNNTINTPLNNSNSNQNVVVTEGTNIPLRSVSIDEVGTNVSSVKTDSNIGNMKVDINGVTDINDSVGVWYSILTKYRNVIVGLSGLGAITMLGIFILSITKLGIHASNPTERNKILIGLIWSGVATTLLASVTIIVGFFWNALK